MEDTTAIVTATPDHCAPVTKAESQQAPGYEEEAGGWDIGTGSAGWNPQSAAAAMELPVLTQPGLGVTKTTVTTITQTGGDWNSSLFNVCGDGTTCEADTALGLSHCIAHTLRLSVKVTKLLVWVTELFKWWMAIILTILQGPTACYALPLLRKFSVFIEDFSSMILLHDTTSIYQHSVGWLNVFKLEKLSNRLLLSCEELQRTKPCPIFLSFHPCRSLRGLCALLPGPESGPPLWGVSVFATAPWLHVCHAGGNQGEIQDTGQCL
uniref:Uncharacterized protein n=1 Tax=Hucho hucho TaxID=62062 RepID=A0A4W5Q7E7_9TELE